MWSRGINGVVVFTRLPFRCFGVCLIIVGFVGRFVSVVGILLNFFNVCLLIYRIVLCCTILCCAVLFYAVLYYSMLCCAILCRAVMCCDVLCCVLCVCSAVLCYAVLCYFM